MPTPLVGARPMTAAERQARRRERQAQELAEAREALRRIADEAPTLAQARALAVEALAEVPG
jgi:hypothetical protein